jgi:hypothetical protein
MLITATYIEMCRKAKMLQDLHIFKENDLFYSPSKRIEKLARYLNNKLVSTLGDLYSIEECYWLPTIEQIKEMFQEFLDDPDILYQKFLNDKNGAWKYPWPQIYFRSEEERWLALYIAERLKLFWHMTIKEWFNENDLLLKKPNDKK